MSTANEAQVEGELKREVGLWGAVFMGLAYLAASRADQLWQFYVFMFLAGFFGAAGIFAPVSGRSGLDQPLAVAGRDRAGRRSARGTSENVEGSEGS